METSRREDPEAMSTYPPYDDERTVRLQEPVRRIGLSLASMIIGIMSLLVGFVFVPPLVGVATGIAGLVREPEAKAFAWTGIITSVAALVLWGALLVLFALWAGGQLPDQH